MPWRPTTLSGSSPHVKDVSHGAAEDDGKRNRVAAGAGMGWCKSGEGGWGKPG